MNKIELRKKIRKNLSHIVVLTIHPKLGYICEFVDDKLRVNYTTIDGKIVKVDEFTLDDYKKKWDFEEPDIDDSFNDIDITAAELIEIAKQAEDEKYSKLKQAVTECVDDIKRDAAQHIRYAAMSGAYSYTPQINIKVRKYIRERSLCEEFEKDFEDTVYMRLCEFYNPKGFTVSLDKSYAETTLAVLSWDQSKGEAEDESIQTPTPLQTNEDLNNMLKDAYDEISRTPHETPFVYYNDFNLPHYNFHKAEGLHPDLVCPYCGARHYEEGMTMQSLAYVPRIYKDGILQDTPDPNWTVTHYRCLECGKQFETKNGEVQKIENIVTAQGSEIDV